MRVKHAFTQEELAAFHAAGETVIISGRNAGQIVWSHGVRAWIVQPITRKGYGMPLTGRGRCMATTPEYFQKILQECGPNARPASV